MLIMWTLCNLLHTHTHTHTQIKLEVCSVVEKYNSSNSSLLFVMYYLLKKIDTLGWSSLMPDGMHSCMDCYWICVLFIYLQTFMTLMPRTGCRQESIEGKSGGNGIRKWHRPQSNLCPQRERHVSQTCHRLLLHFPEVLPYRLKSTDLSKALFKFTTCALLLWDIYSIAGFKYVFISDIKVSHQPKSCG